MHGDKAHGPSNTTPSVPKPWGAAGPTRRPFYLQMTMDHNGQTWTIKRPVDQRGDPEDEQLRTGSRDEMQWLHNELGRMLDGTPA